MIFGAGGNIGGAIALLLFAALILLVIGLAQVIRALMLPGWRKLLYPGQMGLSFLGLIAGETSVWLLLPIMTASTALGWITRREDPDLGWFALLSMMITWGMCMLSYLTV